jgi:hypothetical protein
MVPSTGITELAMDRWASDTEPSVSCDEREAYALQCTRCQANKQPEHAHKQVYSIPFSGE